MDATLVRGLILSKLKSGEYDFRERARTEMRKDFGLTQSGLAAICISYLEDGGEITARESTNPRSQFQGQYQYLLRPEIEGATRPYIKFVFTNDLVLLGMSAHEDR